MATRKAKRKASRKEMVPRVQVPLYGYTKPRMTRAKALNIAARFRLAPPTKPGQRKGWAWGGARQAVRQARALPKVKLP